MRAGFPISPLTESDVMTDTPKILGARGGKLWADLQATLEFDPHEEALLLEVCRTLDLIDALALSVDSHGVMIGGSAGQDVLNPAVSELRQAQQSYARLVTMLNLNEAATGASIISATSASASAAANARWSKVKRARNA